MEKMADAAERGYLEYHAKIGLENSIEKWSKISAGSKDKEEFFGPRCREKAGERLKVELEELEPGQEGLCLQDKLRSLDSTLSIIIRGGQDHGQSPRSTWESAQASDGVQFANFMERLLNLFSYRLCFRSLRMVPSSFSSRSPKLETPLPSSPTPADPTACIVDGHGAGGDGGDGADDGGDGGGEDGGDDGGDDNGDDDAGDGGDDGGDGGGDDGGDGGDDGGDGGGDDGGDGGDDGGDDNGDDDAGDGGDGGGDDGGDGADDGGDGGAGDETGSGCSVCSYRPYSPSGKPIC
eukprot:bmy_18320T0